MFQYFYGPDSFGARETIYVLAKKAGARIKWIDPEEMGRRPLDEWLSERTSLFGAELPVFRGALQANEAARAEIIAAAGEKSERPWAAWDLGEIDKRTEWARTMKPYAHYFPVWEEGKLTQWLVREAKKQGGEIDVKAARLMVLLLGLDRWRLSTELGRLLLMTEGVLKEETVRRDVAAPVQGEIFAALDSLTRGDDGGAVRSVEGLLFNGHNEFYVLSMLGYQYRVLQQVKEAADRGWGEQEIALKTKLHPYVVQKNLTAARRFSSQKLEEAMTRIMATDLAIKRGKMDARTGLMMLLMSLNR